MAGGWKASESRGHQRLAKNSDLSQTTGDYLVCTCALGWPLWPGLTSWKPVFSRMRPRSQVFCESESFSVHISYKLLFLFIYSVLVKAGMAKVLERYV